MIGIGSQTTDAEKDKGFERTDILIVRPQFIHIEIRNRIRDTNPDVESTHIVNAMQKRVVTMKKGVIVSDEEEGEYIDED